MMKAVIDRFEGNMAILLVGEEEQRINVPKEKLPEGSKDGTWLQIELQGGEVIFATIDAEETEDAKRRIEEKLAALRRGDQLKK